MSDDFKPETWTYAGRRFGSNNKMLHCWNDGDGKFHYFDKAPTGAAIGGQYKVDVKRVDDRITARGIENSTYKGMFGVSTDDWKVEDRTAVAQQEAHRSQARDAKKSKDIGDLTLSEIPCHAAEEANHAAVGAHGPRAGVPRMSAQYGGGRSNRRAWEDLRHGVERFLVWVADVLEDGTGRLERVAWIVLALGVLYVLGRLFVAITLGRFT
jgi:hypothetical protein